MDLVKFRGWNNIYAVERFEKEFEKLTKENVSKNPLGRYNNWLHNRCEKLDSDSGNAVDGKCIEDLHVEVKENGDTFSLYSVRYSRSKLNPRVIFTFMNGKTVILLCCFAEKSSNDYDKAINLCKKRLKALCKEG